MTKKFALKRLAASDLTFFKWHYHNRQAGNQKAFNLDAKVFVEQLYPLLLNTAENLPNQRISLDLYLYGPGFAPAHNLQRKILKQQKNWRLNGEYIHNPDDAPERYNSLVSGDFALFEFTGFPIPSSAKVVLIAQANADDAPLHRELQARFKAGSMFALTADEVEQLIDDAAPAEGHPIYDWSDRDAIEDIALGGAGEVARVIKRRRGRGLTPEELQRAKIASERVGLQGEELLNEYFGELLGRNEIESFEWVAATNAISPFDFRLGVGGTTRVLDVKSTAGEFSNRIHISLNEIMEAAQGSVQYDIYRLFKVSASGAKLRIARNVGPSLALLLETLSALPGGVTVDSLSLDLNYLSFEEQEIGIEQAEPHLEG